MILVKKRYLFMLTVLFCLLVVFGEIKFFMALKSVNVHANLALKYEIENFIFATVVVFLLVFLFFVGFIRSSENILKRMDKMIQLSEYGKHDVSAHLKRLGKLGKKVSYLTYHLDHLNRLRTLKISSLSGAISFLMERSKEMLFLTDCQGKILDCSGSFAQAIKKDKKGITGKNMNDFLTGESFKDILQELNREKSVIEKDQLFLRAGDKEKKKKAFFKPVMNSDNQVANVIGILEGDERFDFFGKRR